MWEVIQPPCPPRTVLGSLAAREAVAGGCGGLRGAGKAAPGTHPTPGASDLPPAGLHSQPPGSFSASELWRPSGPPPSSKGLSFPLVEMERNIVPISQGSCVLNQPIQLKSLEQCLVHSKRSVSVSCCYELFPLRPCSDQSPQNRAARVHPNPHTMGSP